MVETKNNLEEQKGEILSVLPEMGEMLKNIQLAQESVIGYKFSCSGLPGCSYCAERPIAFVCLTVKEAEEHSLHNSVAMWIEKV